MFVGGLAVVAGSCAGRQQGSRPANVTSRGVLAIETRIAENDSFGPSTAIVNAACDIAMIGSSWGTLSVLRSSGQFDTVNRWVPGAPRFTSANGNGNEVILWAHSPEWWGTMRTSDWRVVSLPIPASSWAGRWTGPATLLGDSLLALASISDRSAARERPEKWVRTPLVQILNPEGRSEATIDSVSDSAGKFLPWASAWRVIGSLRDTLLTVGLVVPELSVFARDTSGVYRRIRRTQLPQYLHAQLPKEEVVTLPWIQYGGDLLSLSVLPAISAATFGPSGLLYAVRTYAAIWNPTRNSLFRNPGQWMIQDDDLEIYDLTGQLKGAYELPRGGIDWLRVDEHGRLILHAGHELLVAQDPVKPSGPLGSACPRLPPHLKIPTVDSPPPRFKWAGH